MKEKITTYFNSLNSIINRNSPSNIGLLGGHLGLALYYHYCFKATNDEQYAEKATAIIESILLKIDINDNAIFGTSLSSGSAGLAYVLTCLSQEGVIDFDLNIELTELDFFLFDVTLKQIKETDLLDFLHGAMGVIHYFLQRLPHDKIAYYIEQLVKAFCNKAIEEPEGIWFKNIVIAGKEENEINFSLSHGLSSFLLILIAVAEKGIEVNLIKLILERGLQMIKQYRKETDFLKNDFTLYPFTINSFNKEKRNYGSRLAWCYGDLGIAMLCIKAGPLLNNSGWIKYGNIIGGISCMRKNLAQVGANDSHFCHGTSGLAQFYKHLYDVTQLNVYKDAWYHWVNETIQLLPNELEQNVYKGKECDLLEGLVGVNLVLLSYLYPENLKWSKLLLL